MQRILWAVAAGAVAFPAGSFYAISKMQVDSSEVTSAVFHSTLGMLIGGVLVFVFVALLGRRFPE